MTRAELLQIYTFARDIAREVVNCDYEFDNPKLRFKNAKYIAGLVEDKIGQIGPMPVSAWTMRGGF